MLIPVNKLITKPEQRAVTGAPCIAGAVEEDDILSSPRLPDGLAVELGPLLGVEVMIALRVRAGEQDGVVGETLTEVRHPSRGTVADEFLLDNVLDPIPRLRVRQVHEGRPEVGSLDPVRFALPILYQVTSSFRLLEEVAAVVLVLHVVGEPRADVGHEPHV